MSEAKPTEVPLALRFLRAVWAKAGLMIVLIVIGQKVGEWYPISHFPMYSVFGKTSWYVYVTNQDGDPIPVERVFSIRAAYLKKVYKKKAATLRGGRDAAEATLAFLRDRKPASLEATGLQLKKVSVKRKDGKLLTSEKTLGRLEL